MKLEKDIYVSEDIVLYNTSSNKLMKGKITIGSCACGHHFETKLSNTKEIVISAGELKLVARKII